MLYYIEKLKYRSITRTYYTINYKYLFVEEGDDHLIKNQFKINNFIYRKYFIFIWNEFKYLQI